MLERCTTTVLNTDFVAQERRSQRLEPLASEKTRIRAATGARPSSGSSPKPTNPRHCKWVFSRHRRAPTVVAALTFVSGAIDQFFLDNGGGPARPEVRKASSSACLRLITLCHSCHSEMHPFIANTNHPSDVAPAEPSLSALSSIRPTASGLTTGSLLPVRFWRVSLFQHGWHTFGLPLGKVRMPSSANFTNSTGE